MAEKHENFSSYIWKRSYIFSTDNEKFVAINTENLGNKVLVQIFLFLSKKISPQSNFSTSAIKHDLSFAICWILILERHLIHNKKEW